MPCATHQNQPRPTDFFGPDIFRMAQAGERAAAKLTDNEQTLNN